MTRHKWYLSPVSAKLSNSNLLFLPPTQRVPAYIKCYIEWRLFHLWQVVCFGCLSFCSLPMPGQFLFDLHFVEEVSVQWTFHVLCMVMYCTVNTCIQYIYYLLHNYNVYVDSLDHTSLVGISKYKQLYIFKGRLFILRTMVFVWTLGNIIEFV